MLSANLHNGALVANYPFDNSPPGTMKNTENPSPDDKLFKHLASTYSNVSYMYLNLYFKLEFKFFCSPRPIELCTMVNLVQCFPMKDSKMVSQTEPNGIKSRVECRIGTTWSLDV